MAGTRVRSSTRASPVTHLRPAGRPELEAVDPRDHGASALEFVRSALTHRPACRPPGPPTGHRRRACSLASLALAESAKTTIAGLPADTGLEPLLARAHFATGAAYWELLALREAEDEFAAAYFAAVEYDDAYQFEAGCRLASLTASQSRDREARQWLAHCEAAYDADPQRHERSSLVLARGIVANHALDWDAALREYGEVIAMCGAQRRAQTGSTARHNLARLHTARGDDARAFAAWREVAEFDAALFGPDADGVLLARAYMADARIAEAPAEALAELDAVLALQLETARSDAETEVEMLEIRASAEAALGRTDEALHDALAALDRARATQSPALLLFALGRAAGAAEDVDVDRALGLYDEALAVPLDDARQRCAVYLGRGSLFFREHRYAEGHADHDAARRLALDALGPRDPMLAILEGNVAQAWIEQGRPDLALAAFDRAIAASPTERPEDRLGRSEALAALGRFEDAAADYAAVLAVPSLGAALTTRAANGLDVAQASIRTDRPR